jgi:serine/threonine protein phosphatase PrpC
MFFNAQWLTHKGSLTDDNRDHCAIALRDDAALYLVVDGSSQSTQSGELARVFIQKLADRFLAPPFLTNAQQVVLAINELSANLKGLYPAGRLSFLALLNLGYDEIYLLHVGDCRIRVIHEGKGIEWLSRPHTLANAIDEIDDAALVKHDDRHILTRSFRTGRQSDIEINQYDINEGKQILLATDGYWAELEPLKQHMFIEECGVFSSSHVDDVSCLLLSCIDGENSFQGEENFYLVKG